MFENILVGKYIHADSFLHKLDPRVKILSLIFISIAITFLHAIPEFIFFFSVITFVILSLKIPLKSFLKNFRPISVFLLLIYLTHLFLGEGFNIANIIIARFILIISFATILTITTQINNLVKGLEKLLSFLKILKINPATVSLMIGLSIRFIPVLFTKIDNIIRALKSRGVIFNKGSFKQKIEKYALIFRLLFKAMDTYANNLSISMSIRGFKLDQNRTSCYDFKIKFNDYLFLTIIFLVNIFIIFM